MSESERQAPGTDIRPPAATGCTLAARARLRCLALGAVERRSRTPGASAGELSGAGGASAVRRSAPLDQRRAVRCRLPEARGEPALARRHRYSVQSGGVLREARASCERLVAVSARGRGYQG